MRRVEILGVEHVNQEQLGAELARERDAVLNCRSDGSPRFVGTRIRVSANTMLSIHSCAMNLPYARSGPSSIVGALEYDSLR